MKNYRKEEEFVMDFEKIFESYGYEKIRLNTFEKYDTYFANKDMINENNLLKIMNPKGDLYVLRPDMTLPVVKYFSEQQADRGKFYYNDSVFRADKNGLEFNERKQVGIEYLGGENILSDVEVLDLAVQTLEKLDQNYILCISNTEFIKEMVNSVTEEKEERGRILEYLYRRSSDLENYLKNIGVGEEKVAKLLKLNRLFGNFEMVKETLYEMAMTNKQRQILEDLETVLKALDKKYSQKKIEIDFSISVALQYYNGLIFKGYISDIRKPVLSGGRYDKLVTRFGKDASALGFCLEIDNYFESIKRERTKIDYLLLYSDLENGFEAMEKAREYRKYGKTVRVLTEDKSQTLQELKEKYSIIQYF
ncbi:MULTISPECIES: ATP phosphoribosyltransferase regulatory subunit [Psychrilyobacter]|uniref:ATP phosphoribosyltransferase regulatory subunit n=1 Tax=Psychrilyobacter piezotolerans TaxID=2293438 RepID=A0ABX9KE19_9FUSO|nr:MULTISPECIES: ATP phosphoribosyltransferase regulatory subunit [Psychrilyobacter]MCS5422006.1 ATP phosphoribosyltransferase regulatory subunit [Psychrilyobacter sp. S5]NDI78934.1 ATP phosphoribosyltransferase regulatory subunit [Psychrilyobacter piezotolerans]RDE59325.1 ATP phosphoribosyltransferase regulatory subunit [Psychrilyobacter sp. S5]REI39855.1 ATP phosphoribosyltransferase regulatory subunit [Psychrilyobacter piezotolerans]